MSSLTALFDYLLLGNGLELVPVAFRLVAASLLAALIISEGGRLHWALALAVLASQLWGRQERAAPQRMSMRS